MSTRQISFIDELISQFDRALRVLSANTEPSHRELPQAKTLGDEAELDTEEKRRAAGLMRANHSGKVCTQALYQGQAFTAKQPSVRQKSEQIADRETDHLSWCETRLKQLNSHTSRANLLWFCLSYGIGAGAGLASNKLSRELIAATEEQDDKHLEKHLHRLPIRDEHSRAIVEQMLADKSEHAQEDSKVLGVHFPKLLKIGMSAASKVISTTSYRF